MQTTEYLTHEDLHLLDILRGSQRTTVKAGLFAIPFFMGLTILLYSKWLSKPEDVFIIIAVCLAALTLAITSGTVNLMLKLYRYRVHPPHGNMKYEVTDQLLEAEVISNKLICYTLGSQTINVYIPVGYDDESVAVEYRRHIKDLSTMKNIPVTLSYATFEPGINILLSMHYNNLSTTETIVPLENGNKYKTINNSGLLMGCVIFMGFLGAFTLYAASRFSTQTLLMVLMFPLSPIAIIAAFYYSRKKRPPFVPVNKIVLTSTITEKLTVQVKGDESTYDYVYFRLGDGSLTHVDGAKGEAGDQVQINFLQKQNGDRGDCIGITIL